MPRDWGLDCPGALTWEAPGDEQRGYRDFREASKRREATAMESTARLKAASLACEGAR